MNKKISNDSWQHTGEFISLWSKRHSLISHSLSHSNLSTIILWCPVVGKQIGQSISSWLLVLLLQTEARPRPKLWGWDRGRGQNFGLNISVINTSSSAMLLASTDAREALSSIRTLRYCHVMTMSQCHVSYVLSLSSRSRWQWCVNCLWQQQQQQRHRVHDWSSYRTYSRHIPDKRLSCSVS